MFNNIDQWVDYIDGVSKVLSFDFNLFNKELMLDIKITEDKEHSSTHQLVFENIASFYFNGGEGKSRLERINPEEMNWQIFEFSYHPDGISFENQLLKEYETHANFLININTMLIAVESNKILIDSKEIRL